MSIVIIDDKSTESEFHVSLSQSDLVFFNLQIRVKVQSVLQSRYFRDVVCLIPGQIPKQSKQDPGIHTPTAQNTPKNKKICTKKYTMPLNKSLIPYVVEYEAGFNPI